MRRSKVLTTIVLPKKRKQKYTYENVEKLEVKLNVCYQKTINI